MRYAVIFLFLLISVSNSATTLESPMQGHEVPATGAWFEGWYTRVTDTDRHRSFAFIVATARPESRTLAWQAKGYEALIVRTDKGIAVEQSFPSQTSIQNTPGDFKWTDGRSVVTVKSAKISVGHLGVHLKIEKRKAWDGDGPEGRLAQLPLPLHWYVDNAGGWAKYELEIDGRLVKGEGFVHQEKNWGTVFPSAWIWAQAVDSDAYLAVAGGDLGLGPVTAHSFLVGYRSKTIAIDFNAGLLAKFNDQIDACSDQIVIEAATSDYRLEIEAVGSPRKVALAIPTETGFSRNGASETFDAKIRTKLFKKGWLRDDLIEEHLFENAALEFGAASQVCRRDSLARSKHTVRQ